MNKAVGVMIDNLQIYEPDHYADVVQQSFHKWFTKTFKTIDSIQRSCSKVLRNRLVLKNTLTAGVIVEGWDSSFIRVIRDPSQESSPPAQDGATGSARSGLPHSPRASCSDPRPVRARRPGDSQRIRTAGSDRGR